MLFRLSKFSYTGYLTRDFVAFELTETTRYIISPTGGNVLCLVNRTNNCTRFQLTETTEGS